VWQCYLGQGDWNLYFFEVMSDQQTQNFRPDRFLDIEGVRDLKKQALDCHRSQKPDDIWAAHDAMHRRRGADCGIKYAEAYLQASPRKGRCTLPFLRSR